MKSNVSQNEKVSMPELTEKDLTATQRKSFVFYESWWAAVSHLPQRMQGIALRAIIEYAMSGEIPDELPPVALAILELIRPQIEANNLKYLNGIKGGESGKLGGRPPKKADNAKSSKTKRKKEEKIEKTPTEPQQNPLMINEECKRENEKEECRKKNDNVETSSASTEEEAEENRKEKDLEKFLKLREEIDQCKNRPIWRENMQKKFHLDDPDRLDEYLEDFFVEAQCRELDVRNVQSYFTVWLEKRLNGNENQKQYCSDQNPPTQNNLSDGYQSYHPYYRGLESRMPLIPGHGLRD